MNVHKNARLTPYRRAEPVMHVQCGKTGSQMVGVSVRTVRNMVAEQPRRSLESSSP